MQGRVRSGAPPRILLKYCHQNQQLVIVWPHNSACPESRVGTWLPPKVSSRSWRRKGVISNRCRRTKTRSKNAKKNANVYQEESFPQKSVHPTPQRSSPVGCHSSWLCLILRPLAHLQNGCIFSRVCSGNSEFPSDSSPHPSRLRKDGGPWRVWAVSCQSQDDPQSPPNSQSLGGKGDAADLQPTR